MKRDQSLQAEGKAASARDSDLELEERVRVFLDELKVPGLRSVTVDVEEGVATMSGTVSSFYEKQLVTHCCQRVTGLVRVENRVHVHPVAPRRASAAEKRLA